MNGGRSHWLTLMLMLAVSAAGVGVAGCHGAGPSAGRDRHRLLPADEVAVPPGINPTQITPFTGEALAHASQSLAQILADLSTPEYLSDADALEDGADREGPVGEPTVEVQRAYVQARQAWQEERHHEAIELLDAALGMAPGQPNLLRLQARAYGAIGNRLRAAMHLRQSFESAPDHVESLTTLGRLTLEQGEVGEAIVLFSRALEAARTADEQGGPPLAVLHYYLAAALLEGGYDAAAIDQHQRHIEQFQRAAVNVRQRPEMTIAQRQRGATWVAVGDAHHRLGASAEALRAYEQAMAEGLGNQVGLIHRLVYTHLRLGRAEPAVQLAIERVREAGDERSSLALIAYLTEQGISVDVLADALRAVYTDKGEPGAVAIAIAELLPDDQGVNLLREHLASHPADELVYGRLLDQWLLPEGAAEASHDRVHQAVAVAAMVINNTPGYGDAEAIAARLFDAVGDTSAMLDAWATMDPAQRDNPVVRMIEGMALGEAGRMDEAANAFEKAIQADPAFNLARLQLVKVLIVQERYDRAARLLEPLEASTDSAVVLLRVRVLVDSGRAGEALALLDQVIGDQPRPSVELVVQQAQLQMQGGDVQAAEQTLLDALNVRPTDERLYSVLLNLYNPAGGVSPVPDAQSRWQRLVRRLLENIPESRLGRLVRADIFDSQGHSREAEALLLPLLDTNDRDYEAIQLLLRIYLRSNRQADARALIERLLDAHPTDQVVLRTAQQFYQHVGDRDKVVEMVERMLRLRPAGPERTQNLASLYMQTGQPERAVAVIDEALAADEGDDPMRLVRVLWRAMLRADQPEAAQRRLAALADQMPEYANELLFERAMLAERLENHDQREAMLLELLDRDPDHSLANNALAYAWAEQNRNLEQAKAMIKRAVEAEPDNAAYLDSLGWVYYKLGQFEDAVVWLRRSRAAEGGEYPVIVDHLGDALYRLGQTADALQAWRDAQRMLNEEDFSHYEDPELETLGDWLTEKIEAVDDGREPPVAELPDDADSAAAAEPSDALD